MATTLAFDAGLARQVAAVYATPDVAATRIAVLRAGQPQRGQTALDIGCGPGFLTRDLALCVGDTGAVVAVDMSAAMLALARERCGDLDRIRFEAADALSLPVADGSVDLACVLQVYCYVRDLDAALAELRRTLKPGGRAVILDSDFAGLVWQSRDRARMRRVLDAYDGHVAWPDLPRILPGRLKAAGLERLGCETVPFVTLSYHPHTYVYGLARFIRTFVVDKAGFAPEEADAWLQEFDALDRDGDFFFSFNRFLFTVRRS